MGWDVTHFRLRMHLLPLREADTEEGDTSLSLSARSIFSLSCLLPLSSPFIFFSPLSSSLTAHSTSQQMEHSSHRFLHIFSLLLHWQGSYCVHHLLISICAFNTEREAENTRHNEINLVKMSQLRFSCRSLIMTWKENSRETRKVGEGKETTSLYSCWPMNIVLEKNACL